MALGVRERARHAFRTEIADAMSNLFAERGFDAVTVDEAAREVGISRATFFRYFGSKEDAVLAVIEASAIDYARAVADLPPVPGETAWQLLHRGFTSALALVKDDSELARARLRMIYRTPTLDARLTGRRRAYEEALTAVVAERLGSAAAARAVSAAALAGLDLAWRLWSAGEEPALAAALDRVFTDLIGANAPIVS